MKRRGVKVGVATSVLKADWRLPVFSRVVQTRPSRSPTINSGCFRCSPSLGRGRKAVPIQIPECGL
jgi:hypothetical protein